MISPASGSAKMSMVRPQIYITKASASLQRLFSFINGSAIAGIDILQVLAGKVREAVDEVHVRGRPVRVLPAGKEAGDVERNAAAPAVLQGGDPLYHVPELCLSVVHAGDHEVREL